MVKISGIGRHLKRLTSIRTVTPQEVARHLYAVGQQIEVDAELSIVAGSISGDGHIPSNPGEPPNADTRHLDGNIETVLKAKNPPLVTIESNAEYSADLEYGTKNMEARPFMRPALEKNRAEIRKAGKDAINTTLRRT